MASFSLANLHATSTALRHAFPQAVFNDSLMESLGMDMYRLKEKTLYGGIEEPDEFGEKLYLKGEEKLCVSKARHQLVLGDGDAWIKNIAQ